MQPTWLAGGMARSFDVVLFGPTGVTGREVARYLGARAPELGLTWAVAGRDRSRIRAVLRTVDATPDGVLSADVDDERSISAMVARARVVANLVGPYARFGEPVHRACAAKGVHELDLTGEIDWVAQMITRHDAAARASGAAIVPCAGFESLPFDLGARLAATTAFARHGAPIVDVDAALAITATARIRSAADAVSGGTFASIVEMVRRGDRAGMTDPRALDPEPHGRTRYELRPRRHTGTGAWLAPMFPSPFINPPVVHRGAALLRADGDPVYASTFRYREGAVSASMLPGPALPGADVAVAAMMAGGQGALGAAGNLPAAVRAGVADAMARMGPRPGDGPRVEDLDAWAYRIDVRATTAEGGTADVVVEATGHPGYKSTATLVGEAALALAGAEAPPSGYGTPATALGIDDLDRYVFARAAFSVVATASP